MKLCCVHEASPPVFVLYVIFCRFVASGKFGVVSFSYSYLKLLAETVDGKNFNSERIQRKI